LQVARVQPAWEKTQVLCGSVLIGALTQVPTAPGALHCLHELHIEGGWLQQTPSVQKSGPPFCRH
jgi:hypothetical protein